MASIFSKIIDREIPADIVYEDEWVIAFLDINPLSAGHTLLIPKKAFTNIFDGDPEVFAHMAKVAMRLGQSIKSAMHADGVNLIMSNGEAAGQEVLHAHLHIIPRKTGDGVIPQLNHDTYADGESARVAAEIATALEASNA